MRRLSLVFASAATLLVADAVPGTPTLDSVMLQKVYGKWRVISFEVSGKAVAGAPKQFDITMAENFKPQVPGVLPSGGSLRFAKSDLVPGGPLPCIFYLYRPNMAKGVKAEPSAGIVPVIFEVKGDSLKIALPVVDAAMKEKLQCPESFDGKGKKVIVIAAKRIK